MLHRLRSRPGPIGLDLAHDGIRALQLGSSGGRACVIAAGAIDVPASEYRQLPESDRTRFVRDLLSHARTTGRRCAVRLPRSDVRLQSVRLPDMQDDDLRQAVAWEAAERMEVERDELEADFIRLPAPANRDTRQESRSEVIMIAARRSDVLAFVEPLLAAGLRPSLVEPDLTAIARIAGRRLRRDDDQERVQAVLHVEADGATVSVMQGMRPVVVKPLPIGGDAFTAAITERLRIDDESARGLRARRIAASAGHDGHPETPEVERAAFDVVRPLMAELARELVLCLRYFGVTYRGQSAARVLLTGPDAHEPRLAEVVGEATRLSVMVEDGDGLLVSARDQSRRGGRTARAGDVTGAWCVAAGLAMHELPGEAGSRGWRRQAA